MSLQEKLQSDLHQAMRAKDRVRLSVIRMLRSSIGYEEIDKKRQLDDSAILDIITRQVRQRHESIQIYKDANRQNWWTRKPKSCRYYKAIFPHNSQTTS